VTDRIARPLVESALLAALGSVLILVGYYAPVIGPLAVFLWPLPSAVALLRHGLRWGVMCSVVTGISLLLFIDLITAVGLWIIFAVTGVSFGYAIRTRYSPATTIAFTSVAFLIGTLAALLSAYFVTGFTPEKLIDQYIESMKLAADMNRKITGPNPLLEQFGNIDQMKPVLLRMFPAILLFSALFQSYLNYEVSRRVLSRLGYSLESLPPFSRWIFPEYIAHAGILSYLLMLLEQYHKVSVLARIGENVFVFCSLFFLIDAFAVIAFYLLRLRVPRALIFVACLFLFANPVFNTLLTFFGIIDILLDFRRIRYGWLGEI